jgi:hypothetical protein
MDRPGRKTVENVKNSSKSVLIKYCFGLRELNKKMISEDLAKAKQLYGIRFRITMRNC